jgi:molybdate transport system ATP-binding protein
MADCTLSVSLSQAAPIPLDVSFACASGELLAIFGPSGSGKTTILRTIAGLYAPRSGRVSVGGEIWLDTSAGVAHPPHTRATGFVFQEYALFPHMTALTNVMTALGHRPKEERRERAEQLLRRVYLSGHLDKRPSALSGGERQRVALARALAREPDVLLLDEPFAAVDSAVRRQLQDIVQELRHTLEVPVVLVTHDLDDVVRLATHMLVLEAGRVIAAGPAKEMVPRCPSF